MGFSILYIVFRMNTGARIKIISFTDLNAWKEGHKLVLIVYGATKDFPQKETFGLTNQMRRAVVSVTSNVAEGFSRMSVNDKYHFYSMAHGSLMELQNQLLIARDVQYLQEIKFDEIIRQTIVVSKLISGLKRIKSQNTKH